MTPLRIFFLVISLSALVACASAPTTAPIPTPNRPPVIRIELGDDIDVSDLPRHMAVESLRELGYQVELLDFKDNALSAQALVQGDLDVGYLGGAIAWAAVQQGAKIATVLDGSSSLVVLATLSAIETCQDLAGKRIAVPSLTSNRAILTRKYIEKNCPTAQIEPIVISSQNNMLAAMTSGQIEGATIESSIVDDYRNQGKSDIHILVRFADEFPGIGGAGYVVRREFLDMYPQATRDLIRTTLLARRRLQDPDAFAAELVKFLKMEPATAKVEAARYVQQKFWNLNSALSEQVIQNNIDFLTDAGTLKPGLKPSAVADLTFQNAVLDEIGRR